MPPLELSPAAQHWVNVALVWIGFGALAGLVARAVLPLRRPDGPAATLVLGIVGSAVGLLFFSFLFAAGQRNPIGPAGFMAALGGTLVVLVLYQPLGAWRQWRRMKGPQELPPGSPAASAPHQAEKP